MLQLKKALATINKTQKQLAEHCVLSNATIAQVINHNQWPKCIGKEELKEKINHFLWLNGSHDFKHIYEVEPECSNTQTPDHLSNQSQEDKTMLLHKNSLSQATREHFKLDRDPFTNEMRDEKDVFVSQNIRYVRAQVRQVAEFGGMMALTGESGAGKSTLRKDLVSWNQQFNKSIMIISPYSELGMEGESSRGNQLRAQSLVEAVIYALDPHVKLRRSIEARARQQKDMLRNSARSGIKHALVIEEAHRLSIPTLKHMKQFYELEDGFRQLISVIMIGQPELESRLSVNNPEVREVAQRTEFVRLNSLSDDLADYIKHKFSRIGLDYKTIITDDGIDTIRTRLQTSDTVGRSSNRTVKTTSYCYPLAVNNLLAGAMNVAAETFAPVINGEIIAAAIRRNQ